MNKVAVRNLSFCTKDCLCLYVCPTGATDTEDSIIDVKKCIGCGACFEACPSKAISMVPIDYPIQQKKENIVIQSAYKLSNNKSKEEKLAFDIANKSDDDTYRLYKAISYSSRLVNEDILREAGYMLMQSGNTKALLKDLLKSDYPNLNKELVKDLLKSIRFNEGERKMKKYRCLICGYEFESDEENPVCLMCNAEGENLKVIEENE